MHSDGMDAAAFTPPRRSRARPRLDEEGLATTTNFLAAAVRNDNLKLVDLRKRTERLEKQAIEREAKLTTSMEEKFQVMRKSLVQEIGAAMQIVLRSENLSKTSDLQRWTTELEKNLLMGQDTALSGVRNKISAVERKIAAVEALTIMNAGAGSTNNEILRRSELAGVVEKLGLLAQQIVVKAGLRKKMEQFTSKVLQLERDLQEVMNVLEDRRAPDNTGAGGEHMSDAEEYEAMLAEFRLNLTENMPVHLEGLTGRLDLNGRAGLLKEWFIDKGRWEVRIGSESVLIRPQNLVP